MLKIHLMGISGSGMSGVATLASKMGYEVTGCDLKSGGHSPDHLKDVDLLVVSPAILYQEIEDTELIEGKKRKIVTTWEEFLGTELAKGKKIIAIAGTHGKSTTTGMVGKLLEDNGFDPCVIIGANFKSWGGNSRYGKGDYFVTEADEFNDNFLHYHPEIAIINNIEFDHPDYFNSEKQLFDSFHKFTENLVGQKILIANWDDEGVKTLLSRSDLKGLKKVRPLQAPKLDLNVIGIHNQHNAQMVIELGKVLEIPEEKVVKSLKNFEGVGRRMEEIDKNIFDDYAHHPTAIRTTLSGFRGRFHDKNIWAIIEPHGYKRTEALLNFYKGTFDSANRVIIGPIFKARDKETFAMTSQKIAEVSGHSDITSAENLDEILEIVRKELKPNDIFVIMGAGNSDKWAREIAKVVNGYSFKDLTTLKTGGKIKHYFEVKNKKELIEKAKFAKENNLSIFIIGDGTDIAVSDNDFNGVVIKYIAKNSKTQKIQNSNYIVTAEAGMNWDDLVKISVDKNLTGIECLSGIPGTVGASPIQNIGAYGQELSETFLSLTAYDIERKKFVKFDKKKCEFGYRESIFKTKKYWQRFAITDVTLKLSKYEDKDLELQIIRDEILRVRSEKLENPKEVPNAGSFFKNPIINIKKKLELEKKYSGIKIFNFKNNFKVSAGWLIEKAGWKGKSLGPVKVSDKHALILTNPDGKGTFKDIKKLADAIIEDVKNKFGIKLEPEVQYINI